MNWLDTETKSILWKEPELKLAPPKAGEFALVLLKEGKDFKRLVRALQRTNKCTEHEATNLACSRLPYVVNQGLTEAEALYGQFELICCDSISVFLRSEILSGQSDKSYLETLLHQILASSEFQPVIAQIESIPKTELGEKFIDQFLGKSFRQADGTPKPLCITFKKARLMKLWADRIGVRMICADLQTSDSSENIR